MEIKFSCTNNPEQDKKSSKKKSKQQPRKTRQNKQGIFQFYAHRRPPTSNLVHPLTWPGGKQSGLRTPESTIRGTRSQDMSTDLAKPAFVCQSHGLSPAITSSCYPLLRSTPLRIQFGSGPVGGAGVLRTLKKKLSLMNITAQNVPKKSKMNCFP